jgi:hypothetical protein
MMRLGSLVVGWVGKQKQLSMNVVKKEKNRRDERKQGRVADEVRR